MTIESIETRMSFPDGGTECPPEENPLPGIARADSPTSSDTSSKGTYEDCPSSDPPKASTGGSKRKKRSSVSWQRTKRRNHKNLPPPLEVNKSDESFGFEQSCDKGKNVNESADTIKDDKRANDIATNGNESVAEDLKKSTTSVKSKPMSGDGGKEEAASRKSMRLRLRGRNGSELYGPKERPRYVEKLDNNNMKFDDEKAKIMFMDALGMCPGTAPKKVKLGTGNVQKSLSRHCSRSSTTIKVSQAATEKRPESEEIRDSSKTTSHGSNTGEASVLTTPQVLVPDKPSLSVSSKIVGKNIAEPSKATLQQTVSNSSNNDTNAKVTSDDDDEGWQCWLTRLTTTYVEEPVNKSPTEEEIKESLIRLVRLGTKVNRVGVSSSVT